MMHTTTTCIFTVTLFPSLKSNDPTVILDQVGRFIHSDFNCTGNFEFSILGRDCIYEGEIDKDNKPFGQGVAITKTGNRYVGTWQNGVEHGHSEQSSPLNYFNLFRC